MAKYDLEDMKKMEKKFKENLLDLEAGFILPTLRKDLVVQVISPF